jgi:hypothetical protein
VVGPQTVQSLIATVKIFWYGKVKNKKFKWTLQKIRRPEEGLGLSKISQAIQSFVLRFQQPEHILKIIKSSNNLN